MLKKDTNLLIAIGQRNPISVGIDYKEAWVIIGNAAGSVPHHKGDALEKKEQIITSAATMEILTLRSLAWDERPAWMLRLG